MSEKEKSIVSKLMKALPKMNDFDKGYLLGKVETLGEQEKEEGEKGEQEDE